jgi:hypothetical protein
VPFAASGKPVVPTPRAGSYAWSINRYSNPLADFTRLLVRSQSGVATRQWAGSCLRQP